MTTVKKEFAAAWRKDMTHLAGGLWSSPYILLALANLFWAGNFIVGRAASEAHMAPIALAFWRWAGAFLIVLAIGHREAWRERSSIAAHLPILALFGFLSVTLYNSLLYVGLTRTTALNGLFLQSAMPLVIMLFSYFAFGDRIGRGQAFGIVLSFCGVGIILTRGEFPTSASLHASSGDLFVLGAVAANALYFSLLRRRPKLKATSFLIAIFGLGTMILLPAMLWESANEPPPIWGLSAFASVAYLAIFASCIALLFFNRGVELLGANRAGVFLHLMPAFGAILATIFLSEAFYLFHLVGIAAILAGIVVATRSRSSKPYTLYGQSRQTRPNQEQQ